jgi:hypothetical protein
MAMSNCNCTNEHCVDGAISIFFLHFNLHYVREDSVPCWECNPETTASAHAYAGEEEISIKEYYKLIEEGWRELNPV